MILKLHAQGLSNSEMGRKVDFDRRTIARVLRDHGLRTADPRVRIIDLGDGLVECTKCGVQMPRADLPWGRKKSNPYQISYCRDCLTRQVVANSSKTWPQYLKHRQRAIKARCGRDENVYDLPDGFLYGLFEKQGGLCFYTDIPMKMYFGTSTSGPRPDSLSVDQVVPRQGYTTNNVVLATRRANIIKNDCSLEELALWLPDWHKRIIELWESLGIPTTVMPGWEVS